MATLVHAVILVRARRQPRMNTRWLETGTLGPVLGLGEVVLLDFWSSGVYTCHGTIDCFYVGQCVRYLCGMSRFVVHDGR